ncbi:MAG: ADP-ribosylglycohydrolase family protein [Chloroflexota bacterium]
MSDDVRVSDPDCRRRLQMYPLPAVEWPSVASGRGSEEKVRDRYRGSLLWGAVGDALGRPVERRHPAQIRDRFGPNGPTQYIPWHGWSSGPAGTITDDTQLTMEVSRCLVNGQGQFDPEAFSRQLIDWLPIGRGRGRATTDAIQNLIRGQPWWQAGVEIHSAGNGAAMRAAPIGLAHAFRVTPQHLMSDALLSSLPTHTHPVGVAGAIVIAAGVAWCVREVARGAREIDANAFLTFVTGTIQGLEQVPTPERRPAGGAIRLIDRLRELSDLLTWDDPDRVLAYTYNGAFALESVPAALYCFLRTPDDPREVILTAIRAGFDADTVASMAGNLVGAWVGAERLRATDEYWWSDLEYREELCDLGDALAGLAGMQ